MKSPPTWYLVMNSTRARILRGLPERSAPMQPELVMRCAHRHLRDIMADKPGRTFSSGSGGRRSAMAYASDPVRQDQREFLQRVIDLLETHRRGGGFGTLAVFAEPQVLGMFREMVPPSLAARVVEERPLNLLHLSPRELVAAIGRELEPE